MPAEAERMVRFVTVKGPPSSDGWEDWRLDRLWAAPILSDYRDLMDG